VRQPPLRAPARQALTRGRYPSLFPRNPNGSRATSPAARGRGCGGRGGARAGTRGCAAPGSRRPWRQVKRSLSRAAGRRRGVREEAGRPVAAGVLGEEARQVRLLAEHRRVVDQRHHEREDDGAHQRVAQGEEVRQEHAEAPQVERVPHHAVDPGVRDLLVLPQVARAPDPHRDAREHQQPGQHEERRGAGPAGRPGGVRLASTWARALSTNAAVSSGRRLVDPADDGVDPGVGRRGRLALSRVRLLIRSRPRFPASVQQPQRHDQAEEVRRVLVADRLHRRGALGALNDMRTSSVGM
jgi:hypothetical protein